jgi:hypothetical protein
MKRTAAVILLSLLALPARAEDARLKWKKEWGPMVPHSRFSKDCSLCHVPKRWDALRSDFSYDHKKETGFALLGAHADAACLRCHNDRGPVKAYLARGCGGCHVDPHKATLGNDCERCHEQTSWVRPGRQGEKLAAHARTRFPLTGAHAVVECRQCHLAADRGEFTALPTDCVSCHAREYASAPNHAARGYGADCRRCHQPWAWRAASFDHAPLGPNPVCMNCHAPDFAAANKTAASRHAANGFPQTCRDCHGFTAWGPGTSMKHARVGAAPCYACHSANYASAPNHASMGFSTSCQTCHTGTSTWLGAVFDHTPLGPNPVCWNCHQTVYNQAKRTPSSNHALNAFPTTCQNCHNYAAWGPGTPMQHAFVTTSCQNCHMDDFNAAKSPVNHVTQGIFASACSTCHTSYAAWGGFTHNPSNCYSTGSYRAHQGARCAQCHATPVYTTATCTACHENRGNSCD